MQLVTTEPEPAGTHGLSKDTVRADMARACAIVHGRGAKLSLLELCVLVMKDGLLNEKEREELLARKLQSDA
jgi:hypothetical protein